jgi:hypothetical protein
LIIGHSLHGGDRFTRLCRAEAKSLERASHLVDHGRVIVLLVPRERDRLVTGAVLNNW